MSHIVFYKFQGSNLSVPNRHFCWQLISKEVSPRNTKQKLKKWALFLDNYIEPTNTERVKQFTLKYTGVFNLNCHGKLKRGNMYLIYH